MPSDSDNDHAVRGTRPALTAVMALAAILLLMGFSVFCFRAGSPTLGGTAGMAAIGLIGVAVRGLLKAGFPASSDTEVE